MKLIQMPVQVLDDECLTCEHLDIVCNQKGRLYSGVECVAIDIQLKCTNLDMCRILSKRFKERNKNDD